MIYFENNREYILRPAELSQFEPFIAHVLDPDEEILAVCQTVRDGMIFTTRRIIAVDIQGMLGTQTDLCALFFRSVQTFAAERRGDRGILELFLAGQKQVRFVFDYPDADISALTAAISRFTI